MLQFFYTPDFDEMPDEMQYRNIRSLQKDQRADRVGSARYQASFSTVSHTQAEPFARLVWACSLRVRIVTMDIMYLGRCSSLRSIYSIL